MSYPEKHISSLEEITEADVTYIRPSGKFVRIQSRPAGYFGIGESACFTIHRPGFQFDFETQGHRTRTWKTLTGAIRFIKKNYTL